METKSWYKSKAVWSNILVVIVAAVTAVDANFGTGIMSNTFVATALTFLGGLGIYGRVTAKTTIK